MCRICEQLKHLIKYKYKIRSAAVYEGFKTNKIKFFYLSFSYLKTSFPDFKFHIIFLRLACVHAIKVFFANLLQLI